MPYIKLQVRRGTAAEWIDANPILSEGELAIEISGGERRLKMGDGSNNWIDLPYVGLTGAKGDTGPGLQISGNSITGNLLLNQQAGSNNVYYSSAVQLTEFAGPDISTLETSADIIPTKSHQISLGSADRSLGHVWTDAIHMGDSTMTVDNSGTLSLQGAPLVSHSSKSYVISQTTTIPYSGINAISNNGKIIVSNNGGELNISYDGGSTFTTALSNIPYFEVHFTSYTCKNILLYDNNTTHTLKKSTDFGRTWTTISNMPEVVNYYYVRFTAADDLSRIYLLSESDNSYYSVDGGISWISTDFVSPTPSIVTDISGKYIVARDYTSSDSGITWTLQIFTDNKYSTVWFPDNMSMSRNGRYVVFVGNDVDLGIYTSTDYGQTFTLRLPFDVYNRGRTTMSVDGKIQYALVYDENDPIQKIYMSYDYGLSWSLFIENLLEPAKISCSADGMTLLVADKKYTVNIQYSDTNLHVGSTAKISADTAGNILLNSIPMTATTNDSLQIIKTVLSSPTHMISGIAASTNGKFISLVGNGTATNGTPLYVSNNGGSSFTMGDSTVRNWVGIAMSSDGNYQVALTTSEIYISTNHGASFTPSTLSGSLRSVKISGDGKKIIVLSNSPNCLYSSVNNGQSWDTISLPHAFSSISIDTTGSYIMASGFTTGTIWRTYKTESGFSSGTYDIQLMTVISYSSAISPSGKYFLLSNTNGIWHSSDYGFSFSRVYNTSVSLRAFAILENERIQIALPHLSGNIIMSYDYGKTWDSYNSVQSGTSIHPITAGFLTGDISGTLTHYYLDYTESKYVSSNTDIEPLTDNVYNLGSRANRWKSIAVGDGGIKLNDANIVADNNGIVSINDIPLVFTETINSLQPKLFIENTTEYGIASVNCSKDGSVQIYYENSKIKIKSGSNIIITGISNSQILTVNNQYILAINSTKDTYTLYSSTTGEFISSFKNTNTSGYGLPIATRDLKSLYIFSNDYMYLSTSYRSIDGGSTWSTLNIPEISNATCNEDGSLVLLGSGAQLMYSTDNCNTVNQSFIIGNLSPDMTTAAISVSSSGKYITFTAHSGDDGIYTSSTYGRYFTRVYQPTTGVPYTSMSADGKVQTVLLNDMIVNPLTFTIYQSTDYGSTWTPIYNGNGRITSFTCDLDTGLLLTYSINGQGMYQLDGRQKYTYSRYCDDVSGSIMLKGTTGPFYSDAIKVVKSTGDISITGNVSVNSATITTDTHKNLLLNSVPMTRYIPPVATCSVFASDISAVAWTTIAASRDGQIVAIAGTDTPLYLSTNGGGLFSTQIDDTTRTWVSVAMSDSGQYITAVSNNELYVSNNTGSSWTSKPLAGASKYVKALEMSADGSLQMLFYNAIVSGTIRRYRVSSTDYGSTWASSLIFSGPYNSFKMNESGTYYLAGGIIGSLWGSLMSTTYGLVVVAEKPGLNGTWGPVAVSRTGQHMLAHRIDASSGIWRSADYGATFTLAYAMDSAISVKALEIIDDGRYQTAIATDQKVYASADYGETWNLMTNTTNADWIASSDISGGLLAVADSSGSLVKLTMSSIPGYYENAVNVIMGPTGPTLQIKGISDEGTILITNPANTQDVYYSSAIKTTKTGGIISLDSSANIIPSASNTYSIGSATRTWKDIWLSNNESLSSISTDISGNVLLNSVPMTTYIAPSASPTISLSDISASAWTSIAASYDGQIVAIAGTNTPLYISTNGGSTFSVSDISRSWVGIAMSDTGTYITAISTTNVYVSSNTGSTWASKTSNISATLTSLTSVGMSRNGSKQLTFYNSSQSYPNNRWYAVSTDFGATWSTNTISYNPYTSVQMSIDGSYYLAGGTTGYLFSKKNGVEYTTIGSSGTWGPVAVSRSGQYMLAHRINTPSGIWRSTDYGATFSLAYAMDSAISVKSLEIIDDGRYQTAIATGQKVYASADYGETWNLMTNTSSANWIASSDISGGLLAVADSSGSLVKLTMSSIPGYYVNATSTIVGATGPQGIQGFDGLPGDTQWSSLGSSFTAIGPSVKCFDIASSYNGQFITLAPGIDNLYVSSDFGTTWTPKSVSVRWNSIAMSSTGKYQVAVDWSYGKLYLSSDFGNLWNKVSLDSTITPYRVAISSSGQYITFVCNTLNYNPGPLYTSSDYGVTWIQRDSVRKWRDIKMSASGKYQVATNPNTPNIGIYISNDYGVSWVNKNTIDYTFVAISNSGQYITLAYFYIGLVISSDFGETWKTISSPSNQWYGVSMSGSGRYQVLTASNKIYVSNTYGNTWSLINTSIDAGVNCISNDGRYMMVARFSNNTGQINISESVIGGQTGPSLTIQGTGATGTFLMNHPSGSNTVYSSSLIQQRGNEVWLGDSSITSMSGNTGTWNGRRLVFDNAFNQTAGSGTAANKVVLHNNTSGSGWIGGLGTESNAITYHSGGAHNFYSDAGNTGYGTRVLSTSTTGTTIRGPGTYENLTTPGNILTAGLTIGTTNGSTLLKLGAYYTGGTGAASAIQSSDFFSSKDNVAGLCLNPMGGSVGIGRIPVNTLDIATTTRTGTHVSGRPLYITGDIGAASDGVEIRHTNGTRGIGFGYGGIYTVGSGTDLNLDIYAKGEGYIYLGNNTTINGIGTFNNDVYLNNNVYMNNAKYLYAKNSAGVNELFMHPRWTDNITYINYGSGGFNIRNNSSTSRMFIKDNGDIGIGTTTPNIKLEIYSEGGSAPSGSNMFYTRHLGFTTNGTTPPWEIGIERSVGTSFAMGFFTYAGTTSLSGTRYIRGYIEGSSNSATSRNTSFNFTGQHRSVVRDMSIADISSCIGLIVVADNNMYINMGEGLKRGAEAITISESLPLVSLCRKANDKRCFGVISLTEDLDKREWHAGHFVTPYTKERGDTRAFINSIGEGAVWVLNVAGPLESGDYITTSAVPGYGQRQADDLLHNYTVAKITMDCDFSAPLQPKYAVRKDVSGENVLDVKGNVIWDEVRDASGNIVYERAYEVRYVDDVGGLLTRAEYDTMLAAGKAVYIAAFVGCTYHCG